MERFFARIARPAGVLALIMGLASVWAIVYYAPLERIQGPVQKIMYLHVPAALASYISFAVVAVASGMFLWKRAARWDRVAHCSAEVGVLLTTLMLVTGMLWGKPMWGHYWVWDARLTSSLLLWLIYVVYFVVRAVVPDEKGLRFAAVLGILGVLDVPFINIAAERFRTMHPPNVMKGGMTAEMGATLTFCIMTMVVFYVYLLAARIQLEGLRERVAEGRRRLADLET